MDYKNTDFYALLGLSIDATESEIRSAYRKQALKCHPDKTSEPGAVKQFQQLCGALEVLTDKNAREAYDRVWRARRNQAAKRRLLDSKRQKLKDDLEAREKKAHEEYAAEEAQRTMEREIERLRKEGSKILETEKENMRKEFEAEVKRQKETDCGNPRLKVKPNEKKEKLSENEFRSIFGKYGELSEVVVGKKGTALLEFNSAQAAVNAYNGEYQRFNIEWVQGKPSFDVFIRSNEANRSRSNDFENVVLMKLRREEERKREIAKLEAEESKVVQQSNFGRENELHE